VGNWGPVIVGFSILAGLIAGGVIEGFDANFVFVAVCMLSGCALGGWFAHRYMRWPYPWERR
jgi:hypothetical protein